MFEHLQTILTGVKGQLDTLSGLVDAVAGLLTRAHSLVRHLRQAVSSLLQGRKPAAPPRAYETLWLDLVLDLKDPRGERAVLTRRQRVRFLTADAGFLRELFWGEGRLLARYRAQGAHRVAVHAEGSRGAVLLEPDHRAAAGDRLTVTSRRTIRGGFRRPQEYFEVFLERPTGALRLTILFPTSRPPRAARLVLAVGEQVLRSVPTRYGPGGRPLLRCRVRNPVTAVTYSLRWDW